jgi:hypothetical protein
MNASARVNMMRFRSCMVSVTCISSATSYAIPSRSLSARGSLRYLATVIVHGPGDDAHESHASSAVNEFMASCCELPTRFVGRILDNAKRWHRSPNSIRRLSCRGVESGERLSRFFEAIVIADVDPARVGQEVIDALALSGETQVDIDDRKYALLRHQIEDARRNHLDSGEVQPTSSPAVSRTSCPRPSSRPFLQSKSAQAVVIEDQIAGCLERTHRKCRKSAGLDVGVVERAEVDARHDVRVVHEKRLFLAEVLLGMFEAATGLEPMLRLLGYVNFDTERVDVRKKVDDLIRVMMNVDDQMVGTGIDEATRHMFEHGFIADSDERLRRVIGERLQAGPEPRREYHGFHGHTKLMGVCGCYSLSTFVAVLKL